MDVVDVLGGTHEGQGNEVGILLDGPAQILLVLLGQGRNGDGDAGQVKALVVRHHAGNLDAGNDVGLGDLDDADRDVTVVDQQAVARSAVTGQALKSRTDEFLGAGNVAGRDGEGVTDLQFLGAILERLKTDLGALEVDENRDRSAGRRRRLPHARNDGRVFLSLSMRPVDTRDIHAGVHQCLELLRGFSGRSNSADNLSSTHRYEFTVQSRLKRGGCTPG